MEVLSNRKILEWKSKAVEKPRYRDRDKTRARGPSVYSLIHFRSTVVTRRVHQGAAGRRDAGAIRHHRPATFRAFQSNGVARFAPAYHARLITYAIVRIP